jgi:hypothetical protein
MAGETILGSVAIWTLLAGNCRRPQRDCLDRSYFAGYSVHAGRSGCVPRGDRWQAGLQSPGSVGRFDRIGQQCRAKLAAAATSAWRGPDPWSGQSSIMTARSGAQCRSQQATDAMPHLPSVMDGLVPFIPGHIPKLRTYRERTSERRPRAAHAGAVTLCGHVGN